MVVVAVIVVMVMMAMAVLVIMTVIVVMMAMTVIVVIVAMTVLMVMIVGMIMRTVLAVRVTVPHVLTALRMIVAVTLTRPGLSGRHYAAIQHSSV